MKININTAEMKDVIKKAKKVLPKKSSLPCLEKLYMVTSSEGIKAIASDLENTLVFNIPGEVIEHGQTLLDGVTLKMVEKLKGDNIIIEAEKVTAGKRVVEFILHEEELERYPSALPICDTEAFVTTERELCELLQIKYASSTEEHRKVFNTVAIDKFKAYACDTFRLATRHLPFDNKLDELILLHLNTVNLLDKILDKKSDNRIECKVSTKKNDESRNIQHIKFNAGNMQVYSRLVDGNFVDVEGVIPQKFIGSFVVDNEWLVEELKFATNLPKLKEIDGVPISFKLDKGNTIEITASSTSNKFKTYIYAELDGEFEEFTINSRFLMDTIKHCNSGKIEFKLCGLHKPLMVGEDLISPMRMNQ